MRKIIFMIIITSLIAIRVQAADVKLGYVDLQKVVTTSEQGKEAMKTLDSIEKAKNALIVEKIKAIKKLEEDLAKQGAILTPEAKQKKQVEHDKLMLEYQKMRKDREDELKKNEAEFIQNIVLDVKKLLVTIAEEEGYTAIFNEAVVIYMPDELNLTDRVIKQFNELSKNTKKE
jgi:outer membrane protein